MHIDLHLQSVSEVAYTVREEEGGGVRGPAVVIGLVMGGIKI